ncbi:MAG: DUF5011 domain-containing protein [Verrucomicrobiota bacterium]
MWNGASYQTVSFAGATGQWCHVAVVLSPTNAQFFVNGLPLGTTTNGINLTVSGAPFTIGAAYNDSGNLSNHFAGMLEEVRVWNVARSRADITNYMFQPVTATALGLVACYRFDEAAGIAAYDATTNHLNGVLLNRPWRLPSNWSPLIALNGPSPLTNECHVAFMDPGAKLSASPVGLAAGGLYSLALKADGTIFGWGRNDEGQTSIPANATNVVALAAGEFYSLALKADGTVVGWGRNDDYGEITIPASATNLVALAACRYHSLALKADGTVVGWGNNDYGQTTIPTSVTNVVALTAGALHSLALKGDGTVVGWGAGGLGTSDFPNYGQATIPASATNVVALAAGHYHSLALRGDGTVVGWGAGGPGTSGFPHFGQTTIPVSATNVVALAVGNFQSLAIKWDGTVVGWGYNGYGQTTIPVSATNVVALAAGNFQSLALKGDGTAIGWGFNNYGQATIPTDVYLLNLALSVSGAVNPNAPGVYNLAYNATNALGAVVTTARTVVIVDTQPPVLALLGDNPLLHAVGAPFTDPGATATDLCAGDLTGTIVITNTVNFSVTGSYTNIYNVTDASGNTVQANRVVTVFLPPPPVFTSYSVAAPGQFRLHASGTAGLTYTLQTSTNLVNWVSHTNLVAGPGGTIDCWIEISTNAPACFHRLRWP